MLTISTTRKFRLVHEGSGPGFYTIEVEIGEVRKHNMTIRNFRIVLPKKEHNIG